MIFFFCFFQRQTVTTKKNKDPRVPQNEKCMKKWIYIYQKIKKKIDNKREKIEKKPPCFFFVNFCFLSWISSRYVGAKDDRISNYLLTNYFFCNFNVFVCFKWFWAKLAKSGFLVPSITATQKIINTNGNPVLLFDSFNSFPSITALSFFFLSLSLSLSLLRLN